MPQSTNLFLQNLTAETAVPMLEDILFVAIAKCGGRPDIK